MGRRTGGCRRLFSKILRCRVESVEKRCSTVDEIVDYLRASYPDYRRIKQKPFTRAVKETLDLLRHRTTKSSNSTSNVNASPERNRRRTNDAEERLLRLENQDAKRRQSEMTSSESDSELESDDGEGEDGVVTTSEDAIYGKKVDLEFDLMNSMSREAYSSGKPKNEEKNVEFEVAERKIELVNGSGSKNSEIETKKDLPNLGSGGMEVKGKDGTRFSDLGGMESVLEELKMEVIVPLYHPQLPQWLRVRPMARILLHGPPGCGKTKLAHAIAYETGVPFYKISAAEVVSGVSGASEENIQELFSKAYKTAPSIVFIDEIDAIASKRENLQREMERWIVTQLMTCMDESHRLVQPRVNNSDFDTSDSSPGYVLVIGATNRPDAVDAALRRPGRFDREIALGIPDENARVQILSVLT